MKKLLSLAALVIGLNAYQIDIKSGWQLKGALEDINVTDVFNEAEIISVWTYDDENGKWRAYLPNVNVNLDSYGIEPLNIIHKGEGFWVNASNNLFVETNISENAQNIDGNTNNISNNEAKNSLGIEEIGSFKINYSYNKVSTGIVDVTNKKVFISDQIKLYIYELDNIEEPTLLNTYNLYGGGRNIALSKDNKKLFIDKLSSLLILNVSKAEKGIDEIGKYENDNSITDFILSNDNTTAFILNNNSLNVIDINDTTNPKLIKEIELLPKEFYIKKLYISNNDTKLYGLIDSSFGKGLLILNLKDNKNSKIAFTIEDDMTMYDMAISKDDRIAILSTSKGLVILDISEPNDIKEFLFYPNDYVFNDIVIASNNKIAFGVNKQKLKVDVLDISNPENPKKVDSIDFLSTYNVPYKIFLSSDETKMFVATTISAEGGESPAFGITRVYIFDVSSYTKK